jgi:Tfp pilus assembly protein PilO
MKSLRVAFSHFAWAVRRAIVRLGWPGLAGLGLLAFSLGFALLVTQPERERLTELTSEYARLSAQVRVRGPKAEVPTVRGQLSGFYAFFPLTESVPAALGRVHKAARNHRLTLEKGEYKLSREQGFPVQRYQVTLPVVGQYAQVRGFVNSVLDAVPNAAVDELILKRKDIAAGQLEARVRFSLFLGGQP